MEITRKAKPVKEMADVKIWHCSGCGVVHMRVKGMILNFSREDFSAFTEAVVDIHYSGWKTDPAASVIDLGEHEAGSHASVYLH